MKRLLALSAVLLVLLAFTACGKSEEVEGSFVVDLRFPADKISSVKAELCGEDGLSFGAVQLKEGKNFLPESSAPCYIVCELGEEWDCPAEYADGSGGVTLEVKPANVKDGVHMHTYTAFLKNYDALTDYSFQMCTDSMCYPAVFESGVARLSLGYADYDLKVFGGTEIVSEAQTAFGASERFKVFDLDF